MSSLWRRTALIVWILGLGAIRPIITPGLVPLSTDFAFHLYRLSALQQLVSAGIPFSRWVPQFVQGYGYPIFNYVPPLPSYAALLLTPLVDSFLAIQLLLAGSVLLGGWATLRFLQPHVGPMAAVIGAVSFMYAPYLAYDALHRSNVAETVALTLVPLVLWRLDRLLTARTTHNVLMLSLAAAALILTHNLVTVMAAPLLVAYALVTILCADSADRIRQLMTLFGAGVLTLGLSAFFWLPAIAESQLVALERLNPSAEYLVTNNLLSLRDLFALPTLLPANLINPSPPPALGAVPCVLLLMGFTQRRRRVWQQALFFAAWLAVVWLVGPFATPIWRRIDALAIFQFPWRWLALGVTIVAILVGYAARRWPLPVLPLAAFLLMWQGQGWFDLPHIPTFDSHIRTIGEVERVTGTLGTTTTGEYVPRTVRFLPEQPASAQLFVGDGIDNVQTQNGRWRVRQTATVAHSADQIVTVHQFAFPGWRATVDGEPVLISPSDPHGFLTFPVTAGEHRVQVEFGPTPLRTAAAAISLASVLLAFGVGWRARQLRPQEPRTIDVVSYLNSGQAGWLLAVAVVGAAWPSLRHTQRSPVTLADYGAVRLVSAEFPPAQAANRPIQVDVEWATDATPTQRLQSTVTLRDLNGVLYSDKTSGLPRRFNRAYPSISWPPDHVVADRPLVTPLPGTPSGVYRLVLTLFDQETLQPLPLEGRTVTEYVLGQIELEPVAESADLTPRIAVDMAASADGLQLIGYDIDREMVAIGEQLLLTLYWDAAVTAEFKPIITLQQTGGVSLILAEQLPIIAYAGNQIQTRHLLSVPNVAELQNGAATLAIASDDAAASFVVPLTVTVPERQFEPPPVAHLVEQPLGRLAMLHGVTVREDDVTVAIELVWQAAEKTAENYRVFVHLLDADDNIVAQSDADPAQWTRPTTGWLPPEYVADLHTMPKPIGPYRVRVGLYLPATGEQAGEPLILDVGP